jgi:hypothetical protein
MICMIRREESDSTWFIHQAAHAYISGQIAQHWVGDGSLTLRPREELLLAATYHDAGWVSAEQQPRINHRGQPRTFTEMDLDEHFVIWRGSIEAVFTLNRYSGLLTSLHCAALYEQRLQHLDDPPGDRARIRAFLDERHTWQDDLIAALRDHPRYGLAVQPDRLADNLRLLQVWDYLSLILCMTPVHEQTLDDVPLGNSQRSRLGIAASGMRGMVLDPFPLDGPLTLWIDARPVLGGPFEDNAALQRALDGVSYQPLVFEVGQGLRSNLRRGQWPEKDRLPGRRI